MSLKHLFNDAHRRVGIQLSREGAVDLGKLWAGLGYPSEFKGKARVFFEPVGRERHMTLGWYKFTEEGAAEYLRRYSGKPGYFEKQGVGA
jgi:hypothetical protein